MAEMMEGRLRAYLDGEVTDPERSDIEAWLEGDADARATLAELRERGRRVEEALALDVVPIPDVDEVRSRVRERIDARVTGGRGRFRYGLAQAAALVLFLAAGAAAAVPGSPLRSWLDSTFAEEAVVPSEVAAGPVVSEEVGVRVSPVDGRLVVVLSGVASEGAVEVRLTDAERGGVFAGEGTQFRSGEGRIEADVVGGAVRVELPRSVIAATVRVGGVVYFEKRGDRVELPGPEAVAAGDVFRFPARRP